MTNRLYKRVETDHPVKLSVERHDGAETQGQARLANISPEGLCLTGVRWDRGTNLTDRHGHIEVQVPLPDWVGVQLKVKPVRIRFSDDALEIGAVIVRKPKRFREVLELLGVDARAILESEMAAG